MDKTYTLKNEAGLELTCSSWGATIRSLKVPVKDGATRDVVLGYEDPETYRGNQFYFGCAVGRVANRIAAGKFSLGGAQYTLQVNNGPNHLHGGVKGFDKVDWKLDTQTDTSIQFSYTSPDGEEGYPGTVTATATYSVGDASNEVTLEYSAMTTALTIVNLTNHTYFNLKGTNDTILGHQLMLNANHYTPVDDTCIPIGSIEPVAGSVFDFTRPHLIGERISQVPGLGYDHNYCMRTELRRYNDLDVWLCARCREPESGLTMEVHTNQPGVQLYTGNFLSDAASLKGNQPCYKHAGFCLETQAYPNAINQSNFPSPILSPGEKYYSKTTWKFA